MAGETVNFVQKSLRSALLVTMINLSREKKKKKPIFERE